ncbi:hypothetical protein [Bacillus mycoides]|uniref:hypothetical protein n=1 Tax=Bacillus mycoides TaxID=1405 RepID=UPI002E1F3AAD|nr:hypothetical protein [Bacillus mycoides]
MCRSNYNYYSDGYGYGYGCGNGGGYENEGIRQFFRTLSPGTCIEIQYDSQRPVRAVFQEFRRRTIVVSNVRGSHRCSGFTHIAINKINAVSIVSHCPNWEDCEED